MNQPQQENAHQRAQRRQQRALREQQRAEREARERKQQTIVGMIVVLIVIAMLSVIGVTAYRMSVRNDTQQNTTAQNKQDSRTLLKKLPKKDVPSAADSKGGILISKNGYAKPVQGVPTIAVYSDPLCPGCGNFNRLADKTLVTMMKAGQINLELHPMSFLDPLSSDHYSTRVTGGMLYIASHDNNPEHLLTLIDHLFARDFQPEEGDGYKPVNNETLTNLAKKAGVPDRIAEQAFKNQYLTWQTLMNDITPTRKELWNISGRNKGAMTTPTCTINNNILDLPTINEKNIPIVDAILKSIGLDKNNVGSADTLPSIGESNKPKPLA